MISPRGSNGFSLAKNVSVIGICLIISGVIYLHCADEPFINATNKNLPALPLYLRCHVMDVIYESGLVDINRSQARQEGDG